MSAALLSPSQTCSLDMAAFRTTREAFPTGAGLQDPGPGCQALLKTGTFSVQTHSGQHWRVLKRLLVPF